ncbi:MAG TPA: tetratricopeptide repeat protein [Armatimonadota bacterium]|nr:tetratricopeptide repeat protein [Armatimonadota bacterium]
MRPGECVCLALCVWCAVAGSAAVAQDKSDARDGAEDAFVSLLVNGLILESDAQFHLGDYRKTTRAALSASALDPSYIDGYDSSAWLIWSMGYDANAVKVLKCGIEANPGSAYLRHALGTHYLTTKRHRQAMPWFSQAIAIEPSVMSYMNLGHCYKALHQPRMAVRMYREALRLDPDNGTVKANLEWMHQRMGVMGEGFTQQAGYLSPLRYYQLRLRTETGHLPSPAEARLAIARAQSKAPLYLTTRQKHLAEDATRPPMTGPPGGMPGPMMGPAGRLQTTSAPDQSADLHLVVQR